MDGTPRPALALSGFDWVPSPGPRILVQSNGKGQVTLSYRLVPGAPVGPVIGIQKPDQFAATEQRCFDPFAPLPAGKDAGPAEKGE